MDQLEKIRRQHSKEHLKMVLREQGHSFTKLRGGHKLAPPPPTMQTSAKFREFD